MKDFDINLLSNYTNNRILGNDGKEFLNIIVINLEYQKRDCEFRTIAKPNINDNDNCQNANDFFGYVAEHIENYLDKQDFIHYTQYFRFYCQSAVKAAKLCQKDNIIS